MPYGIHRDHFPDRPLGCTSGGRWAPSSGSDRSSRRCRGRRISSGGPCATSCSACHRVSTSTSSSSATQRRMPTRSRSAWAAGRRRTDGSGRRRSTTAEGRTSTSRRRGPRATRSLRRCRTLLRRRGSRTTSVGATSRSTPWQCRCRTRSSSTPSTAEATSTTSSCACCTRSRSWTIRRESSVQRGTRRVSAFEWIRRRRRSRFSPCPRSAGSPARGPARSCMRSSPKPTRLPPSSGSARSASTRPPRCGFARTRSRRCARSTRSTGSVSRPSTSGCCRSKRARSDWTS